MTALAVIASVPAAATLYFWVFWTWFAFWRRHIVLTFVMMLGTIGAAAIALIVLRDRVAAPAFDPPLALSIAGWALIAGSFVFGTIADRQLGMRVRAFIPYFEDDARIELRTTGAYAVVRHPIYASGIYFQIGAFLVTASPVVGASTIVFALGAIWFTRQEERRLRELLDDASAYDRYRARVPALLPWPRG